MLTLNKKYLTFALWRFSRINFFLGYFWFAFFSLLLTQVHICWRQINQTSKPTNKLLTRRPSCLDVLLSQRHSTERFMFSGCASGLHDFEVIISLRWSHNFLQVWKVKSTQSTCKHSQCPASSVLFLYERQSLIYTFMLQQERKTITLETVEFTNTIWFTHLNFLCPWAWEKYGLGFLKFTNF